MKKIVLDASVAIKWFIPEVHSDNAARLLDKPITFFAPDLIYSEVGNILWKKVRLKELSSKYAQDILSDFRKMPLDITDSRPLLETAWHIAVKYQRTFYDSLYLALATTKNCLLVTADKVLVNSLQSTELSPLLLWIDDVP